MANDDPIERMKKDAKNIQDRYKKEYRYLYSKMHVETGPKSVNKTQASKPPPVTHGEGWRNKPLTQNEIDDINYFLNKGWCASSTVKIAGVSISTVQKYKKSWGNQS